MVAVFGLVHGVGFAGPLKDLGLRGSELLLPLLGFNLGVELGQLAVVALLLPLALVLRARVAYRRWIVPGGSGAIAALATLWLAERS
ncbi:HupE/UreJ family protein, partial [Acinetobacter baumannii]